MRENLNRISTQAQGEAKGFRAAIFQPSFASFEGMTAQAGCQVGIFSGISITSAPFSSFFYGHLQNKVLVFFKYTSNLPLIYLSYYFIKEKLRGSIWGREGEVGGSIGEVIDHCSKSSLEVKSLKMNENDQGKGSRNLGGADIAPLKISRVSTDRRAVTLISVFFLFEKYILLIIFKKVLSSFKSLILQKISANPVGCFYWLENSEAWNKLRKAEIKSPENSLNGLQFSCADKKVIINQEVARSKQLIPYQRVGCSTHPPTKNSQEKLSTGHPIIRYKMAGIHKALYIFQYLCIVHIFLMNRVAILYIFKEGGPGGTSI